MGVEHDYNRVDVDYKWSLSELGGFLKVAFQEFIVKYLHP
jgi:hypothetical protein